MATGSGSAASPVTSGSFSGTGMTVAEIETAVAAMVDLNTATAAHLTKIDQAITNAGQTACTWDGWDWWFLHSTGTFDSVADTGTYALRTQISQQLISVDRVYVDDDYPLNPIGREAYYRNTILLASNPTGRPESYAIWGEPPTIGIWPTPDDAYTIAVDYSKAHGKIASSAGELIIPSSYQYGIYVVGAAWLLKHEFGLQGSLRDCPEYMDTIRRMRSSDPTIADVPQVDWKESVLANNDIRRTVSL